MTIVIKFLNNVQNFIIMDAYSFSSITEILTFQIGRLLQYDIPYYSIEE